MPINILYSMIAAILFLMVAVGCSKDEGPTLEPDPITEDLGPAPTISGIGPENGPRNTLVTIFGNNFGSNTNVVQVFFNEKEAEVQIVNDTQIKAALPKSADKGLIKVVVNGKVATGPELPYDNSGIQVSTLAGTIEGFVDGSGVNARFDNPMGVAIDMAGNLYVADFSNHKIRKITPNATVSTLPLATLGTGGSRGGVQLSYPSGIAVDTNGNVYVAELWNHRIRKITPNGTLTTLAGSIQGFSDGAGTTARFDHPYGLAVDVEGNVYVADSQNDKIRKIDPNGIVSTLAGSTKGFADGMPGNAQFNEPRGVAVDTDGNVYVADMENHKIRKVTPNGLVSSPAFYPAHGFSDMSRGEKIKLFYRPLRLTIDALNNIYVASGNHKIQKITANQAVHTLAGSTSGFADGSGTSAKFNTPSGITINATGNIFVADNHNNRIRKIMQ